MDTKKIIRSQYLAAFEMLKQAIVECPDSLWDDPKHKNRFWHVAYHTLFYTHLYLGVSEEEFVPWHKHKEAHTSLGAPPNQEAESRESYRKEELLEYLTFCQREAEEKTASLNLDAESGFYWLPMNKLEVQFYNIRHLQQHTGELCERLGTEASIDVNWVGMQHE